MVAAALAVVGAAVGSVIWVTNAVKEVEGKIEATVKEHTAPIGDSVKELTSEFDQFKDTYGDNRVEHLEKHHMETEE